MITGDLNTALVPWVVQYRITDPKTYLFGAREPEQTLRDLSESVMREVIGDRTVDEVLTIGRHDNRNIDIETSGPISVRSTDSEFKSNKCSSRPFVRRRPCKQRSTMSTKRSRRNNRNQSGVGVYNDAVPNARGRAKEREKQAERMRFAA